MIRETLMMSDYQFYSETPSLIDPMKTHRKEAGFGCPHCHLVVKRPVTIEHGQTYVHECGLKMTRYGNALHCELDESLAKAPKSEAEWPVDIDAA